MPESLAAGWKSQVAEWVNRIKKVREALSTAKDVYGELIGIDFDDSSLLCLQLRNLLGVVRISRAEAVGLPNGVIGEDVVVDSTAVASAFKKLFSKAQIHAKNVAIAMPGNKVAIKQIKLDAPLSDEDAETRAWQEARKTFPDLVKSLFLDFVQTQEMTLGGVKKYALVLIVSRKEDIAPRVEALQQAGLFAKIVDVDFYALERAYHLFASQLPQDHVTHYVGLIDFNPHSITLLVMRNKAVIYSTRQVYTGDVLVPLVQRALDVEMTSVKAKPVLLSTYAIPMQAQTIEQAAAMSQPPPTETLLTEEQKTHMVMTIRRLFQTFYSENPGKVIDCLALTGRCALIPDITNHITKTLGVTTIIGNPIAALKMGEHIDAERILKLGPAFAVSCGLAMRGIPLWK